CSTGDGWYFLITHAFALLDDAKVILEPSTNGYNLLHDIIRLSPCHEIEDRYNIIRQRLQKVFKAYKMPHAFHELLCHRAENNISVLSAAVNKGNRAMVSQLVYDIEDYCKPGQLLQELKLFEATRRNSGVSLFAQSLYFHQAENGCKAFTEQNVQIFRFLLRKLRKLASCEADQFVLNSIENSEWYTSLVCHAQGTSKERVEIFISKYVDEVTKKVGGNVSKRRYLAAMPDAVSAHEESPDDDRSPMKRQRMSRWDQPSIMS
ncbi:MAG: hypothetical protein P1U36_06310, partial [Legionellaceae bacterium]|nr:hypothetical protein [Legionellaceae bacterium]